VSGDAPAPTDRGSLAQGERFAAESKEFHRLLSEAVDYRGDVTLRLADGREVEGYLFDLAADAARLVRTSDGAKERVAIAEIRELRISGRDTAAGKTWENWVRRYAERKLRGEHASIESEPLG